MLWHAKKMDPTLQLHFVSYSDTDSMHILGETKEKVEKERCIGEELGYLK